ncbi:MAG: DUF488 family protein [Candidatus Sulfotelmatobacter sp.]
MIKEKGPSLTVAIKRVYDPPSRADGVRILVDRLWPRGLSKASAAIDEWLKDLAPSDLLRRWYHAQPDQWDEFQKKYLKELAQPERQEVLHRLYELAHKKRRLTLLYASKNTDRNNATVLKELLEGKRKPPTGTGPGAIDSMRQRRVAVRRR